MEQLCLAIQNLITPNLPLPSIDFGPETTTDSINEDSDNKKAGSLDLGLHVFEVLLRDLNLDSLDLLCMEPQMRSHLFAILIGLALLFGPLLIATFTLGRDALPEPHDFVVIGCVHLVDLDKVLIADQHVGVFTSFHHGPVLLLEPLFLHVRILYCINTIGNGPFPNSPVCNS